MQTIFFRLFILHIFACPAITCLGQAFVYTDIEDDSEQIINVRKDFSHNGLVLWLESDTKDSRHIYQPLGYTQEWKLIDTKEKHDFRAQRHGNKIVIEGIYGGEPLNKTVEINEQPWINKLDHGLSTWVKSDKEELVFWVLKLNSGLDPIRFEAKKIGSEQIEIPGGDFDAVKVKLTLHGFFVSNLWSAYSWYRASDGLFLKFKGDSGPGTSLRIIQLSHIK